ncbi:hypothetical protein KBZ21_40500, partial [Streptomyces sp. A73]|nr:hypothetical protein [Streptomyces sp. A73]
YEPGEDSVAERTREAFESTQSGRALDTGLFYDSLEAPAEALRTDLMQHRFRLELLDSYFNGEQLVRDLGISIPPQLQGLHT